LKDVLHGGRKVRVVEGSDLGRKLVMKGSHVGIGGVYGNIVSDRDWPPSKAVKGVNINVSGSRPGVEEVGV
jgi:hypothetical protein